MNRRYSAPSLVFALATTLLATTGVLLYTSMLPDSGARSERMYRQLIAEIRCPASRNMSLAGSVEPIAADRRREISDLIDTGMSAAEIRRWVTQRYGDKALYTPRLSPRSAPLWFLPIALLAAVAWVLTAYVRAAAARQ